jgi:hypothetical protein
VSEAVRVVKEAVEVEAQPIEIVEEDHLLKIAEVAASQEVHVRTNEV